MRLIKYIFIVVLFFELSLNMYSQSSFPDSCKYSKTWFASSSIGIQISGIKDEDFIKSNVSLSYLFSGGVWFTPEIALQVSYKGFYFNYIGDKDKHYYDYIFGEVVLDVNEILTEKYQGNWHIHFHPGAGIFFNKYYNRPNVCANIGITNNFRLSKHFNLFLDISVIIGWDIYQGDDDIIPSSNLGLTYLF